jgi:IS5 family transposase
LLPVRTKAADVQVKHRRKYKVTTNSNHKHSAVESAINALEVHGLDRCPDHGIEGFKRYVALSVVARNLQRIGAILTDKAQRTLSDRKESASNKRLSYKTDERFSWFLIKPVPAYGVNVVKVG